MDHDLVAERALLERQIAELESSIEAEGARLSVQRDLGVRPRGLAAGSVIGVLVVLAFLGVSFLWAISTIGRMD